MQKIKYQTKCPTCDFVIDFQVTFHQSDSTIEFDTPLCILCGKRIPEKQTLKICDQLTADLKNPLEKVCWVA